MASSIRLLAKLSGSFAVTGLTANYVGYEGERTFNPLSSLLPTTAHCLSLWGTPGVEPVPRLKPFRSLDSSGNPVKVYPVAMRTRPLSSAFSLQSLKFAVLRGAILTYFPLIEKYFKDAQRAEEEAEARGEEFDFSMAPDFDWKAAEERLPVALLNTVKEVVVGLVRTLLTWFAAERLDDRLAWKLVKDQASSLRAKRVHPFYIRPYTVTRTCLRGSLIAAAAELIVSSCIEVGRVFYYDLPKQERRVYLGRRLASMPVRALVNLVAGSIGAGLIAVIRPGLLCTLASLGAVFATDAFVCLPAFHKYMLQGTVSKQTMVIIGASTACVVLSFLPWISAAVSSEPSAQTSWWTSLEETEVSTPVLLDR